VTANEQAGNWLALSSVAEVFHVKRSFTRNADDPPGNHRVDDSLCCHVVHSCHTLLVSTGPQSSSSRSVNCSISSLDCFSPQHFKRRFMLLLPNHIRPPLQPSTLTSTIMPMAIPKDEGTLASTKLSYKTSLDSVPVTKQRPLYIPPKDSPLPDPSVARANIAASTDAPNGTTEQDWAAKHAHQTVLQQHCVYWDKDNDGVIWPLDTYRGVRAWGWAIPLALLAMFIIHGALSYLTLPTIFPDPLFRIYLARIHKDKHGSDSGSYDTEGRFRPQNYEEIFAKYDRGNKGGLTTGDIWRMLRGQRLAVDPFGWTASFLECEYSLKLFMCAGKNFADKVVSFYTGYALYLLCWPEDSIMRKEDIRRSFDGSIFQFKADEYARKRHRA
jgi:hypothetical protein